MVKEREEAGRAARDRGGKRRRHRGRLRGSATCECRCSVGQGSSATLCDTAFDARPVKVAYPRLGALRSPKPISSSPHPLPALVHSSCTCARPAPPSPAMATHQPCHCAPCVPSTPPRAGTSARLAPSTLPPSTVPSRAGTDPASPSPNLISFSPSSSAPPVAPRLPARRGRGRLRRAQHAGRTRSAVGPRRAADLGK